MEIAVVAYIVVSDGTNLPLINTVFRNLASVLPNVSWNELVFQFLNIFYVVYFCSGSAHPISAVLSSQISDSGTFTTSNPVELEFDITEVCRITVTKANYTFTYSYFMIEQ